MATNIQIKRGSGSNTPSSLLQGELAVNMDTGQLYYGSGSTETPVNSYKFTNVTASGDISASGTVAALSYTGLPSGLISGSSQLPSGIISSSTQLPSGLISGSSQLPSGIISGSSQLPSGIISGSSQLPSGIISGSSQLPSGLISSSAQLPSGIYSSSTQILGNITSSGNISASGHVSASSFIGSGSQILGVVSASYALTASHALNAGGSVPAGTVSSSAQIVTLGFAQTSSATNVTFGNISGSDLYLTGGDIDLKNDGAQSNIRFYCESSNAHYTKLQAAPHSEYSGNPTTTLPTYDFDFSKPNFAAQVTASGDVSASGFVSASSFSGDGSGLSNVSVTPSAGTVSSSAQIEDLGFALTSSVEVYLNFEAANTYHYVVPYDLRFDGFATSSVFTATFSSSGASYTFGSTLNQFSTLHVTASAAGLVLLSGSRV